MSTPVDIKVTKSDCINCGGTGKTRFIFSRVCFYCQGNGHVLYYKATEKEPTIADYIKANEADWKKCHRTMVNIEDLRGFKG